MYVLLIALAEPDGSKFLVETRKKVTLAMSGCIQYLSERRGDRIRMVLVAGSRPYRT
ncbi:hypothetical protein DSUL_100124 [Desulfovibrionales bacterium]